MGMLGVFLLAFAVSAWGQDGTVTILSISQLKSQLLPISEKVNKTSVRIGYRHGTVCRQKQRDRKSVV